MSILPNYFVPAAVSRRSPKKEEVQLVNYNFCVSPVVFTPQSMSEKKDDRMSLGELFRNEAKNDRPQMRKRHKFLHIFNRKVHPESTASVKPTSKSETYRHEYGKNMALCRGDDKKEDALSSLPGALCYDQYYRNTEHWVTTDADYLILELWSDDQNFQEN